MYGTIPIVHATGGLKDSVKSWYTEKETSTGAPGKMAGRGSMAARRGRMAAGW